MKYISGLYALNTDCSLETTGDWHSRCLDWEHIPLWDTAKSPLQGRGIEQHDSLAGKRGTFYVADHLRACIDMMQAGDFSSLQGMRRDYICTDKYDDRLFHAVFLLRELPNWKAIDGFMEKEYQMKWIRFKKEYEDGRYTATA